jgi:pyrroline-5-carboxylate reductase
VFYVAEQMIAAGVALGMSLEQSRTLSLRTIIGSAKMLGTTQEAPAELRRKVTSPGGTTQAAIEYMEKTGVGRNLVDAIAAAAARSKELGV